MRRLTWDLELDRLVRERWRVGNTLNLMDVYDFEGHFAGLYPGNVHLREKLRQTMQHLRDSWCICTQNTMSAWGAPRAKDLCRRNLVEEWMTNCGPNTTSRERFAASTSAPTSRRRTWSN